MKTLPMKDEIGVFSAMNHYDDRPAGFASKMAGSSRRTENKAMAASFMAEEAGTLLSVLAHTGGLITLLAARRELTRWSAS